ncbi:MAG: HAMP domain-containing sensor histidine kinase [Verrucomicrobiota bacterium JB023]|nr:HAMP domain-containing sensor histidine kinase [Verrucomicrobiota bacterium JB023]
MRKKRRLGSHRWGLPLYGQVLCWFFLNLTVVMLALEVGLRWQLGYGVDGLLRTRTEERIRDVAALVAGELRVVERDDWGGILERLGERYEVAFAMYRPNGDYLKGSRMEEIEDELKAFFPAHGNPMEKRNRRRGKQPPHRRWKGDEENSDPGTNAPDYPPPRWPEGQSDTKIGKKLGLKASDSGTKWAWCPIGIGNDEHRHPPIGVLAIKASKGQGDRIFANTRPLVGAGIGLVVLSGLLWLPFVYRVRSRLTLITAGAERISEGDFGVNLASARGDEIGRLSRAIQRMAERLDSLVSGQKRFLGDTAHELCGPLARMRMGLGVLGNRLKGAERERLAAVEEEVEELARLVDELLDFSKASLTAGRMEMQHCELWSLCVSVCEREAEGSEWIVKGGAGIELETNVRLFRRALGNVIRNAVRYGGGEPVTVVCEEHDGEMWVGVLDRGPGLPEEWMERIFEPFARPEEARTREGGGSGLGLAIVKTCMESLGGRVFCRNRQTGGLEVVLVIPLQPPPA